MEETINWLLSSSPWTEYRTRLDILGQSENDTQVVMARKSLIESLAVRQIVEDISNWPGTILISHKSAGHSIHKLVFLADLGLTINDPGIENLTTRIMEHQDPAGPFEMLTNISEKYGGSGKDIWAWGLCDAPLLLYALVKFGLENNNRVQKGIETLSGLVRENGWPCAGSIQYGTFRGPGRKCDPCPFATLIMLQLLATLPDFHDSEAAHLGTESILTCWAERLTFHPYIFYMGIDFCKLKAPLVWYDILHVTHVLSQFSWVKEDAWYKEMVSIISSKADSSGRYTPESIWTAWKDWDFGQKKIPSAWLTYLATKITKP